MNSTPFQKDLDKAVAFVQGRFESMLHLRDGIHPKIGIIFDGGWEKALEISPAIICPLKLIPGFEALPDLDGCDRVLEVGFVEGQLCVALYGRVHLYEGLPSDEDVFRMVRLQVELLIALGVETMILTNTARSLCQDLLPNSLVLLDGFMRYEAGAMPLVGNESTSIDSDIYDDLGLYTHFLNIAERQYPHAVRMGSLVMTRGPQVESRRERLYMARMDGNNFCVGMSVYPEVLICAHHGVKVLPLSWISTGFDELNLPEVMRKARFEYCASNLKDLFRTIILSLPVRTGMVF